MPKGNLSGKPLLNSGAIQGSGHLEAFPGGGRVGEVERFNRAVIDPNSPLD